MRSARYSVVTALAIASALSLAGATTSHAHCDTMDGPVVTEARAALEAGDVTPLLKWVGPEYEDEIRAVFAHVLEVRALGDSAREMADRFLFETLVRIHRAGEGAPYTGLKPAGGSHTAEAAADRALAAGTVDDLAEKIAGHASTGVRERFAAVAEARKHADDSVEAGRAYVAAYVDYVHYVLAVHTALAGTSAHDHASGAVH